MSNEESNNSQKIEATVLQSPAILPLQSEENNEKVEPVPIIESENTKKTDDDIKPLPILKEHVSDSSILGATSMLTNICLGTTIFTFAVRAKQFGLIWLIIATIFCGAVNYWTILRAVMASKPMKEHDYSEITEKLLGRKARLILNFLIILYSYALVCVLLHLCFLYLVDLFNILVIELNIKHMMNLLKLFGINLMLNFIVYYYSIFTKFSLFN